ncbi:hypothetical protein GCM10020255_036380 [Rhodococcus baikonurensis]
MIIPLTISDFLDRAVTVYPDRVAIVDEPDQPAQSWGEITFADLGDLARRQAATLDELGVPVGGRVAIVSHNAARFLASFYGVAGWGRVLVPINYRLSVPEIQYIVEHSGAEVLLVDPELEHLVAEVPCKRTFVLGRDDDRIWGPNADPRPWVADAATKENATATINYTSGTTARPKGVQLTHRSNWINAVVFGWQATVTDRDVYLHTLPTFHANGWGHPFVTTAIGAKSVVLRKVDGAEILRRIEEHGVTYLCAAPAVVSAILDAAKTWEGKIPGRDRVRIIVAGAPPRPERSSGSGSTLVGSSFRSTVSPRRRHCSRCRACVPSGTTYRCPSKLDCSGERAHRPSVCRSRSTTPAKSSHGPTTSSRRTGRIPRRQRVRWRTIGSTPATAALSRTVTSRSPTGRRTSSSPVAKT